MLKISNVRLPVGEDEASLQERCARQARVHVDQILSLRILRKSLDIRDKRNLEYVYTAAVSVADESSVPRSQFVAPFSAKTYELPEPGDTPLEHRPVVVGAGP